ncbi:MAG: alpha-amylase/alpha-mannosidase [Planctomycetota bacterium]|jgi:alpha-amylase/alpha-mannosidase (GH57 family)
MSDVAVALVWHFHQPYYADDVSGELSLPWVRLHGVKDYLGMGLVLERHPEVRVTVNFVPSLLKQLGDLAEGRIEDSFFVMSKRNPADFSSEDALYLIENFFSLNWETMVRKYPRYRALLDARGTQFRGEPSSRKFFSTQELRDLQVLFNLAWFHPLDVERGGLPKELEKKGRDFSEDEKLALLDLHRERLGEIIPLYKRLAENGRLELTTTPYYHPILPLLVNWQSVQEAMPGLPLPVTWKPVPEDAASQVKRAVACHESVFGRAPRGMWPAEGSVSQDMLSVVSDAGIEWIATDEDILGASSGHWVGRESRNRMREPDAFYKPFALDADGGKLSIVFRDRFISDSIGFDYQHMPVEQAIGDIRGYLAAIENEGHASHHLVPVILDGENAWESYPNQGVEFLDAFYGLLKGGGNLRSTTVSDYIAEHPPVEKIDRLFAGSWIGANFAIWAGHDEDRFGWARLFETREHLARAEEEGRAEPQAREKAWEELYIAEGSDWFWWYGDDRSSSYDLEFDRLFRQHLKNVYILLGDEPPWLLEEPIAAAGWTANYSEPTGFIKVSVDGKITSFYEWLGAGVFNALENRGAMARGHEPIKEISFGFDLDNFAVRLDFAPGFDQEISARPHIFVLEFVKPEQISIRAEPDAGTALLENEEGAAAVGKSALGKIFELSAPFSKLGFKPGTHVSFYVVIRADDREIAREPQGAPLSFVVPDDMYEEERWTL